jgi:hypothetical protein
MGLLDKISNLGSRLSDAVHSAEDTVADKVDSAVTEVKQDASAVVSKTEALVDRVQTSAASATSSATSYINGWNKPSGSPGTFTPEQLKRGVALVKDAWNRPNTGRTVSAATDLARIRMSNLRDNGKLTPDMEDALLRGVADRKSDSDRGQAGILGDAQVRDAASTVYKMNAPDLDTLNGLIADAGKGPDGKVAAGADVSAERALIMKAVAARKDRLSDPDVDVSGKAMAEIAAFAKDVRGLNRDELIRTTTALDVQGASNADGLAQKYDNTCAPTTGQMLRAEQDPVFARQLNQAGLNSTDPTGPTADDQAWELHASSDQNHVAVTRAEVADRTSVVNLINSGAFSASDAALLTKAVSDGGFTPKNDTEKAKFDGALARLRTVRPDLTDDKLARFQEVDRSEGGTSVQLGVQMGAGQNLVNHDVKQAQLGDALSDVRSKLKDGQAVPIRIGYTVDNGKGQQAFDGSGHAMLFSDYRDGKYLLSDPYSGKTAWVTEDQIKRGTFAQDFGLTTGNAYVTNYLTQP